MDSASELAATPNLKPAHLAQLLLTGAAGDVAAALSLWNEVRVELESAASANAESDGSGSHQQAAGGDGASEGDKHNNQQENKHGKRKQIAQQRQTAAKKNKDDSYKVSMLRFGLLVKYSMPTGGLISNGRLHRAG